MIPSRAIVVVALSALSCSQPPPPTPATAPHHHHHRASASPSDTPSGAPMVASAAPNPCATAQRPPARLPDGGVNPEACVGVCSLVHHTPVEVDAGAPNGTIDLAVVDRTLRRESRTLRECYESAVIAHPWLAAQGGTVNVRFVVEANGHVRSAPEASGLDDVPDVAHCLSVRIRYILFPAPDGGAAEVTLPFTFDPS